MLHLEHRFVWCWNLDTLEGRSEIPEKFWKVVLKKYGEDRWTDCVWNEVFCRITWKRNILHTIKRRKANWIGHILWRNCLLKHITEGKIKGRMAVMERWGGGHKQLLDDLKEKRGYWKVKEVTLDRILLRTGFEKSVDLSQDRQQN